jgi:hypothetical protein
MVRQCSPTIAELQNDKKTTVSRLSSLDNRFALVPNADLGHAQASLVATLDLRICRLPPPPLQPANDY